MCITYVFLKQLFYYFNLDEEENCIRKIRYIQPEYSHFNTTLLSLFYLCFYKVDRFLQWCGIFVSVPNFFITGPVYSIDTSINHECYLSVLIRRGGSMCYCPPLKMCHKFCATALSKITTILWYIIRCKGFNTRVKIQRTIIKTTNALNL